MNGVPSQACERKNRTSTSSWVGCRGSGTACCAPTRATERRVEKKSDAAGGVGEVEPDFYSAEVGAFGADGGGDVGAEVAGGADVFGELGMDLAELGDFVHAGGVDLFLGVEAGARRPFVEEMKEGPRLDEADGFGVGEGWRRCSDTGALFLYGADMRRWKVRRIRSARRRTPNLLSRLET